MTILDNYALKYYAKIRVLKNLMKARKLNMTMINGHVDITVGISFCLNDFVLMILLCLVFVLNFIKDSEPCKTSKMEGLTQLHEMGTPGPIKGNAQLIRQNYFSLI